MSHCQSYSGDQAIVISNYWSMIIAQVVPQPLNSDATQQLEHGFGVQVPGRNLKGVVQKSQMTQRSQGESTCIIVNTDCHSGKAMTLVIIVFVLFEYLQKHKLEGQRCDGGGSTI